jgi:RES domain-containing protein
MLRTRRALGAALGRVKPIAIHGHWHRAVEHGLLLGPPPGKPPGANPEPLWPGGAPLKGGRYTPKGGAPAVYLANDPDVAAKEVNFVFEIPGGPRISIPKNPTTFIQVDVVLTRVLDLTDEDVRRALRTTESELTGNWRLSANEPPTHTLGAAAFAAGHFSALKAPSSKAASGSILVIFSERLAGSEYVEVVTTGVLRQRLP